jgi:hypothetical protein
MNLKYNGSGDSKENAIYFTNAMTFVDHMKMQREYIRQNNLNINRINSCGNVKDRYMYDIYETENGNIWFKVPNNIIE